MEYGLDKRGQLPETPLENEIYRKVGKFGMSLLLLVWKVYVERLYICYIRLK